MRIDQSTYIQIKEKAVQGRYVVNQQIISFLNNLGSSFLVETNGQSVEGRSIKSVTIGSGKNKILMWSQMHGNESTTTKSVLDLLRFLESEDPLAKEILASCMLKIIPVLNPDGAEAYTRFNANKVDLNRDAQERSQPESKVLRAVYEDFQPDFCFNLHDQRTIYNVGTTSKSATVSFLAPSHDEERSISITREISMNLIAAMNDELQKVIPGHVGRYDDAFNPNCVGDTFQMLHTPTILFEAGHYPEDYDREETRKYIFDALIAALSCIGENEIQSYSQKDYFEIPENDKLFYDIKIRNAQLISSSYTKDIGILFAEVLKNGTVFYDARIEKVGCLESQFGHRTYDCMNESDLKVLKKQDFWHLL